MGHRNTRETQYACRTIPIHAGCFSSECQCAFVARFMKGRVVERYLTGPGFAAANELIADVLAHQRCRFYLQDDSETCGISVQFVAA